MRNNNWSKWYKYEVSWLFHVSKHRPKREMMQKELPKKNEMKMKYYDMIVNVNSNRGAASYCNVVAPFCNSHAASLNFGPNWNVVVNENEIHYPYCQIFLVCQSLQMGRGVEPKNLKKKIQIFKLKITFFSNFFSWWVQVTVECSRVRFLWRRSSHRPRSLRNWTMSSHSATPRWRNTIINSLKCGIWWSQYHHYLLFFSSFILFTFKFLIQIKKEAIAAFETARDEWSKIEPIPDDGNVYFNIVIGDAYESMGDDKNSMLMFMVWIVLLCFLIWFDFIPFFWLIESTSNMWWKFLWKCFWCSADNCLFQTWWWIP